MLLSAKRKLGLIALTAVLLAGTSFPQGDTQLSGDIRQKIDDLARAVLTQTGVPSASVAIVKDGQIAYAQAYGSAQLEPSSPARPDMRYAIGSISKQFTAS